MKVIREKTGAVVQNGALIKDFRGVTWRLVGPTRVEGPSWSGRIVATKEFPKEQREFFATVFNLRVID